MYSLYILYQLFSVYSYIFSVYSLYIAIMTVNYCVYSLYRHVIIIHLYEQRTSIIRSAIPYLPASSTPSDCRRNGKSFASLEVAIQGILILYIIFSMFEYYKTVINSLSFIDYLISILSITFFAIRKVR